MTSTIHADKIMNSSGDQDSGVDLLVNDQVKLKTANTDRVTVTDATTTVANDLAAATIKTATVKHTGGTTGLTIDTDGYINQPAQPLLSRYLYSNQTIANDTLTPLQFNGTAWITNGGRGFTVTNTHSKYTPLATGYYYVSARARFQSESSVAASQLSINVNGSGNYSGSYRGYDYHHALDKYESMHISNIIYLTTSDYFEIVMYQNSGVSQTATGTGLDGACMMSAIKVA